MGMMADRAVKFVIAASLALAIMCFQAWWRVDNWYPPLSVNGLNVHGLTAGDGVAVLLASAITCALALIALIHPQTRRTAGLAILIAGIVMLTITTYDLVHRPEPLGTYVLDTSFNGDYHPTPILYFAAATSFLIGLAGLTMALAPRDRTNPEQIDEGVTAWA
jgi:hypothetical protein